MKRSVQCSNLIVTLLFLMAASLFPAGPAQAAPKTWDNGGADMQWNTTSANWGGTWVNGDSAIFNATAAGPISLTEAISVNVNPVITFNASGYTIQNNTLTLTLGQITVAPGVSAAINSAMTGGAGLAVEGGGTLTLGGATAITGGNITLGSTVAGTTLNISGTGRLTSTASLNNFCYVGGTAIGANVLNVSAPGTSATPSLTFGKLDLGVSSSGNELNISNGAYVLRASTSTTAWRIGADSGADNNRVVLTGTGSSFSMRNTTLRQFLSVGQAGSGNYVSAGAGTYVDVLRIAIGSDGNYIGGGDNNYVLISGAGATYTGGDSQTIFGVGNAPGATGNSFRIEDGATATIIGQTQTTRYISIGGGGATACDGSNYNYVRVKGVGSSLTFGTLVPLAIGGQVYSGVVYDSNVGGNTADGNHLDVQDGGTLTLGSGTAMPSLYVMGLNSAFNLGDGNALSTATVGATSGFEPGVYLKNADGRLNFNNGQLNASAVAGGALVSGAGRVNMNGPAIISTVAAGNTISSDIYGGGALTKIGPGVLTLSSVANFTGNITVSTDTLAIQNATSGAGLGTVTVDPNATLNLNDSDATRVHTVGGLSLGMNSSSTPVLVVDWIDGDLDQIDMGSVALARTGTGKVVIEIRQGGTPSGDHTLIATTGGGLGADTDYELLTPPSGVSVSVTTHGLDLVFSGGGCTDPALTSAYSTGLAGPA